MSEKMMVKIVAALVVIAVVIPPLYLGGTLLHVLMGFVAAVGSYEIAKLQKRNRIITAILYFGIAIAMYFAPENMIPSILCIWAIVLFFLELVHGSVELDSVVLPFILTFLIAIALRTMSGIYESGLAFGGWKLCLFIALACFLCDTGAYFFGVFFGKHKMIPAISPNKTWEGAIGGFVTGCVSSFIFGYLALPQMPMELLISSSIILPITAQIGDLSFSSIKRTYGIKDFGNLIPEHGGVLDRVDSLIFCLVAFHSIALVLGVAV
ncbi:MAG: phosphatidate cytidylyltransferase [Bulleidia sp.]